MRIFFSGAQLISPQQTFKSKDLYSDPVGAVDNRLNCIEPDYKEYIDAKAIRRLSRVIKMGTAAALETLKESNVQMPDAIITATGFGCLEDTIVFLRKMVENKEEMLAPAAFIQSTHNTVGAQIALMLKCNNYNNTFTQRGHSFENALLDAQMLLENNEAKNVLIGSYDEITDISQEVISSFHSNQEYINGEGSAFFVLTSNKDSKCFAKFTSQETYIGQPGENFVEEFLVKKNLSVSDIGILISGNRKKSAEDKNYESVEKLFDPSERLYYKKLCGEFPTSIAFAIWLAVETIRQGRVPFFRNEFKGNNILIYNQFKGTHSLQLISTC